MNRKSVSSLRPRTALDESEIHVWTARPLAFTGEEIERLRRVLSPDESARAEKLRPGNGRDMFVASRGILRRILSLYTGEEPGAIELGYGKGGKPFVKARADAPAVSFNLSHSHELAMYAVAAGKEVGIDVEYLREVRRPEDVIRRFFTETEGEFYRSRPEELKREAFFRLWTFREASVKAGGYGVFTRKGLVIPGPPPAGWLLDPGRPVNIGGSLSLVGIDGPRGYVAAVAVEGEAHHVRKFDFPAGLS
ncbi:MAG TPA: 4'-phosphopantetheinyl transferase superfamily protein [Thermodesulfobacteriota bacterium]|nr:4'-phosphopantetheinyl transferase superfamily protein [Thermodesulfobacteriota bacterium]